MALKLFIKPKPTKMRVALIRPFYDGQDDEMQEPLGAEAICGFLRANGLVCKVFDRRIGAKLSDIQCYEPDAVGFSVMSQEDTTDALRLLQMLKQPGRIFWAGGLFITTQPQKARALFPADTFLCSGEGESSVLCLLTGHPVRELTPDDWVNPSRDDLPRYLQSGGVINLRSARGCRGHCTFCTNSGQACRTTFQTRSLPLIVDEMQSLIESGAEPIFNFVDDEFGDADRISELIELLAQRHLRAAFSVELRPSVMAFCTPEQWKEWHHGGLCRVFTGLENLDPEVLKNWGKPLDPSKTLDAIASCEDAGIECAAGYILFHEKVTPDMIRRQLLTLYQHHLFSPKVALSRLMCYPGSPLHHRYGKPGTYFAPLSAETERLYDRLTDLLSQSYQIWSRLARMLPKVAAEAFLYEKNEPLQDKRRQIAAVNEEAYAMLSSFLSGDVL